MPTPKFLLDAPVFRHASLPSTNDECWRLAGEGLPAGTIVVADSQTAGRGRNGRGWVSSSAVGLYASLLLRPAELSRITLLPLAIGIASVEAVREVAGCRTGIKWPNDVLIDGQKVAGILIEADLAAAESTVVVGFGVNIATPLEELPVRLTYPATSLKLATGRTIGRDELLEVWRSSMACWFERWQSGDTATLVDRWTELDALQGEMLSVKAADGSEVSGINVGVDESGALLLQGSDGKVVPVVAGDVLQPGRHSKSC